MKLKRMLSAVLGVVLALALVAFAACDNEPETISATGISLDKTTASVAVGGTVTITATVTPEDSTDAVTWTSDDEEVATVTRGVVTGIAAGEATITAKAGDKTASCEVTVTPAPATDVAVTGITLDKESASVKVDGTVTAAGSSATITISASQERTQYSVGFRREETQSSANIRPQLFLDLEAEIPFYTIDIDLGSKLFFDASQPEAKQFVLYLTLAENITSSDYNHYWDSDDDPNATGEAWNYDNLLVPQEGAPGMFNGAVVTGYHFDADAQTVTRAFEPRAGTTQIRVQKIFGRDENGNYTGESAVRFYHVAPISETTLDYVHPIEVFYEENGAAPVQDIPASIRDFQDLYGLCSNFVANAGQQIDYYISFQDVPDDPFYMTYSQQSTAQAERALKITMSLSKSYYTNINVVFVQASEGGEV